MFKRFRDDTAELLEAASQGALGLAATAIGLVVSATGHRNGLVAVGGAVAVAGGCWTLWSIRQVGRQIFRMRSLRVAVPGTATVLGVRATSRYADEWHFRRYVDIDLCVALPGAAPRQMRQRVALSPEEQSRLVAGATVPVLAHLTRPVVQIDTGVVDSPVIADGTTSRTDG